MTQTAGQTLASTLRKIEHVGPRTRNHRNDVTRGVRDDMLDAIRNSVQYPGYYNEATTEALRPGYGVALSWDKHVTGGRVMPLLAYRLSQMTPYQFAAYLGRMVDAGITNVGEAETFFRAEAAA